MILIIGSSLEFLTYEPRKGQSPTLSRANCVTVYLNQSSKLYLRYHFIKNALSESRLRLAFHSDNSNLKV